jgi:ubiquinone biosynthesis protein COQ9
MQIEKVKAKARENRLVAGLMSGPLAFLSRVTAPENRQNAGMPGRWRTRD